MKNIFFSCLVAISVISCSKTDIQQTTNSIKKADSLFNSAKDGFKTLDSISKIVSDSTKINSEIRKQTEHIEKVIRSNTKNIDSISAILEKTTGKINKSSEVIIAVDSAEKVLRESKNPVEIMTTISKTIEKISKNTNSADKTVPPTPPQTEQESVHNSNAQNIPEPNVPQTTIITEPLAKSGKIEISVENSNNSRDEIAMELRKYGGEIVTENFGEQNNERKQILTAKIPLQYFDQAANSISQRFGSLKSKTIEATGTDYNPNQMCDLEITLTENLMNGTENFSKDPIAENDENSEKTFLEKFGIWGVIILVCLILIPLMLLIIYLMNRNMKKKVAAEIKNNMQANQQQQPTQHISPETTTNNNFQSSENNNLEEDPYAKYKPKP